MENTKQIKLGKKGTIAVVIIVLIVGAGAVIAKQKGADLHINSSIGTSGQNHQVTEHLDGQVDVTGVVQDVYKSGNVVIVATDNVAIDLSPVYASQNAEQNIAGFIRGDIKIGAHYKAVVQKVDSIPSFNVQGTHQKITQFYQLVPSAPYYFEITP